jgi:hypothetical protein
MLRIEAAFTGKLDEVIQEQHDRAARALTIGTHGAADALKARLRTMVIATFGSQRLANSWRGIAFPTKGKASLGPADLVFSKAPHIIAAFNATTMIRGKNGFWLAIPTEAAMSMRFGNRRPTPELIEQRLGIKLRFVFRPGKASLLVAEQVRARTGKRGGYVKASARALREGNTTAVVMFILVEQVTLKKRFDLEAEYAAAADDMVRRIMAAWDDQ